MSEKKPKNKNVFKIVIIVLLVLVLVGGATFGVMYFTGNKDSATTAKAEVITEITYPLGDFLVNLLDEDGRRYLKVNIYIGYEENNDLAIELEANNAIIRDLVNTYIRSKKTTDFSVEGLDVIKSELIKSINPSLVKGKISHIYFNDILVQ
jgi:flagellar basal body-associated protein FliL